MDKIQMDENQKHYFSTLCSVGNITQAAQILYLSRQGLSKSMKALEEKLGVRLFVRNTKGVELTESGRILLRYIHDEGRLWNTYLAEIRSVNERNSEPVRVGLLSMYYGYVQKRDLLAGFQDDPRVAISIVDGDHDFFWQEIIAGNLEFAITLEPSEDLGLPSIRLSEESLAILLSADDPLCKRKYIDFRSDLRGKTVIQTSPYKGKLYETVFKNHGISCEQILHDKNLMLAQVYANKDCFIIQSQYAKSLITDQVCMRLLINAPLEMHTTFVFRPDLGPMAQMVARKLISPFGKEAEFDAFFEASEDAQNFCTDQLE